MEVLLLIKVLAFTIGFFLIIKNLFDLIDGLIKNLSDLVDEFKCFKLDEFELTFNSSNISMLFIFKFLLLYTYLSYSKWLSNVLKPMLWFDDF